MKLKYKHQLTQSYWAGYMTATLYNTYPSRSDLPSLALCLRDFAHLKTIYGKYYNLLKNSKRTNHIILMYEKFDSQLLLPLNLKGTFSDFMRGYSEALKKHKIDISCAKDLELLNIPF